MQLLNKLDIPFEYERERLPYHKVHHYLPDFFLPNDIIIEYKGYFKASDRTKHLAIKREHPDLDIRFVFERDNYINKKSKTKYSDWCNKHGFKYLVLGTTSTVSAIKRFITKKDKEKT